MPRKKNWKKSEATKKQHQKRAQLKRELEEVPVQYLDSNKRRKDSQDDLPSVVTCYQNISSTHTDDIEYISTSATHDFYFQPLSSNDCLAIVEKVSNVTKHNINFSCSAISCGLGEPCEVQPIIGDGNCFFRALSYIVTKTEDNHGHFRRSIVKHMTDYASLFSPLLHSEHTSIQAYIHESKMETLSTWATDLEIIVASNLFNVDIYVYSSSWLRYSQVICCPEKAYSEKGIYLHHLNQNHFEAVLCVRQSDGVCPNCSIVTGRANITDTNFDKKKEYDGERYRKDEFARKRLKLASYRRYHEDEQCKDRAKILSIDKYKDSEEHKKSVKQYSVYKYHKNIEHRDNVKRLSCLKYHEDKEHRENVKRHSIKKYKENKSHRENVKKCSVKKYTENLSHREHVKKCSVMKYTENLSHREHVKKCSVRKYTEHKSHRENVKQLSVRKYKENILHREIVKTLSVEKYQTDTIHREKVKKASQTKYNENEQNRLVKKTCVSLSRQKTKQNKTNILFVESYFHQLVSERPDHICAVCHRRLFPSQVIACNKNHYNKTKTLKSTHIFDQCISDNYVHKCSATCSAPCPSAKPWVCFTCHRKLLTGKIPEEASFNNMYVVPIPDVLKSLNSLERHLIALHIPFAKLAPLPKSGQLRISGPMVCVPSSIEKTTNVLPRAESDDELIRVKLKRKLSFKGYVDYKLISTVKVQKALNYLVAVNPLYKNIKFNDSWADSLAKSSKVNTDDCPNEQDDRQDPHPHIDDQGLQMNSCLQPVDIGQEILDQHFDKIFCIAPAEGNDPVRLLMDHTNEPKSFPVLFPEGGPTYHDPRNAKITIARYLNTRIMFADGRFSRDQDYIFYAQYLSEVYQVISSVSIAMRKSYAANFDKQNFTKTITDHESVKNIFKGGNGYKFLKPIRGTPAFWQSAQKDIFAMLRQLGIPTWFCSFSCGDTRWPEIIEAILKEDGDERKAAELNWIEKCEVLRRNPVTASRMFDNRFHCFLKHVILSPSCPIGKVKDYFYRIEFQQRGSPHTHCLFWIESAPIIANNSDEEVCNFIDRYISCELPSEVDNPQLHDIVSTVQKHSAKHSNSCRKKGTVCRFNFPRPPSAKTFISRPVEENISTTDAENLEEIPVEALKPELNKIQAQQILGAVWKEISDQDKHYSTVDEIFTKLHITQEIFEFAISIITKKTTPMLKRKPTDVWVNAYNPDLLRCWNANMDIQYITDAYSCIVYIISYISKAEREMGILLDHAHREATKDNEDARKAMKKLGGVYLHSREVCVQEAVYRVCNLRLKECSRKVFFIPVGDNPVRLTKPLSQLKNEKIEEQFWMISIIDRYKNRPITAVFENMCLASFCSEYRVVPKSEIARVKTENRRSAVHELQNKFGHVQKRSRTDPAVIRYPRFSESKEPEKHFLCVLQLFLPYRFDVQLKPDEFITHQQFYETGSVKLKGCGISRVQQIVDGNKLKFEKSSEEIDAAEEVLNQCGPLEDAWAQLCPKSEMERVGCRSQDLNLDPTDDNDMPDLTNDVSRQRTVEIRAPCISPTQGKLLLQAFNKKQKQIFYKVRQWCLDKRNGKNPPPFHLFITGGAGTGKSHLIKGLYFEATRIFAPNLQNPDDASVLLTAPTGVAAFNIEAATIHHTFSIGIESKLPYQPLGDEKLTAMRSRLHSVEIVIIDEISMVDHKLLSYIHGRLRQIKQTRDYSPFGNVSIIAVGDFYQLPPVKGKPLYSDSLVNLWADNFFIAELTQIMRQKEVDFAQLINRLRTRKKSEKLLDDDLFFLQSLETDEENDSLHIYPTNAQVDEYNTVKLLASTTDTITIRAEDFVKSLKSGKLERREKQYIRASNTTLPRQITLAVGARVMLTKNLDVSDGLVNGVFGTVSHILKKKDEGLPSIVFVKFDNNKVGAKLRKVKTTPPPLTESTPIGIEEDRVNNSGGIRRQFPLKLSYACTVHRIQGATLPQAVVSLKKIFSPGQAYVALSRVTNQAGLVIKDFTESAIYCNEHVECVMKIMPQFVTRPVDIINQGSCSFILHNIECLLTNLKEIRTDLRFVNADFICLTETWLQSIYSIEATEIQDFTFHHTCRRASYDGSSPIFKDFQNQGRGGVGVYIKKYIDFEIVNLAIGNLEHIAFFVRQHNLLVIIIYRPPKYNLDLFRNKLNELVNKTEEICPRCIIMGDLNENDLKSTSISQFMEKNNFKQCVDQATTESDTLLDHVYARSVEVSIDIVPTYFSYHEAVSIVI